jgi:tetratricopeptide (TPR) repeat protein
MRHLLLALGLCSTLLGACGSPDPAAGPVAEHLTRGDAALAAGRYGRALAAYTHARDLAPHDPAVQRALMTARAHTFAESPMQLGAEGVEDARYEAELLLDTDKPRAAVYLTALGNVLARQGDVEGARGKYEEALKADAGSALAHTALASLVMNRKDGVAKAKEELEAALRTRPEHAPALLALGQIKLAEGDLPGAVEKLSAALRVNDDFAVRMALGSARVEQQKPAEALEHFQRAAQLDPRSADALGALGQALLSTGRAEEAERALRASDQLRRDEATEIALGYALARQKKPEQALITFTQVLLQDPTSAPALHGAATASEALGKTEQAIELYRRVFSLPAEGPSKAFIADLRKDALARLKALTTPAAGSGAPAAGPAPRVDPLGARR